MVKVGVSAADIKRLQKQQMLQGKDSLASEDIASDKKSLPLWPCAFYNDIDKSQHPTGIFDRIAAFGDLQDEATYKKWAADVFARTMILDSNKWNAFIANPDAVALQADPAFDGFELCKKLRIPSMRHCLLLSQ